MKPLYLLSASLALAGCALVEAPPAQAATVVVTWDNPLTNTDNSPVAPNQSDPDGLQAWRIEYGTCAAGNTFGAKIGEWSVTRSANGPPLTSATQNIQVGPKCFRVYARNTQNESGASNVAARDIPLPTPRAPTNVAAALAGS